MPCLIQLLLLVVVELFREPLLTICLNEEKCSSTTSFSSFLKSKTNELLYEEMCTKCNNYFILLSFFLRIVANIPRIFSTLIFFLSAFQLTEWIVFVKQDVDAGISTLISIYDWLGPSISRRKMGRTRRMREEMVGKMIYSRHSWNFSFDVLS